MANRLWPAAVVYGEIALPAFKKYYGENSTYVAALLVRYTKLSWVKLFLFRAVFLPRKLLVITSIFCFSLGEAFGKEGMLGKSAKCFLEADTIYRVIPGTSHPFYTDDFIPLYNKYVHIAKAVVEFAQY